SRVCRSTCWTRSGALCLSELRRPFFGNLLQGAIVATYKIHPGIGIARLGNSDSEFYLAPETPAGLPQACDSNGNPSFKADGVTPVLVTNFRDREGRIKRQAARFQVFVYDDRSPD